MKKNLIFTTIFTILTLLIFINIDIVKQNAINSIFLWRDYVFPSLFIMFIIQDLLINYEASTYLNIILNNSFRKLFGLSKNGQLAFTLSLISGSPTNAYTIKELYSKKLICKEEANHLLEFSYFANPLFCFTMLLLIFNDKLLVLKLLICIYSGNFLYGIISKKTRFTSKENYSIKKASFGLILTNSIKKAMNTLIMILGSITFFMILGGVINVYMHNSILVNGVLEITAGLNALINYNSSMLIKEILAVIIISFGGLSVHSQIYCIISEENLSYIKFLKGRIIGTIISIIILLLLIN